MILKRLNILFILLIFSQSIIFAQYYPSISLFSSKNELSIGSYYYSNIGSNYINSSIAKSIYFNNSLDNNLKTDLINNLKLVNNISFDLQYNAFISKKINRFRFFLSYGNNQLFSSNIQKDGINLILNGNKLFENETAVLDNSNFSYLKYKYLQIGSVLLKNKFEFGIALSYLNGTDLTFLNVKKAQIYTAEYGEYLYANWDVTAYNTNESKNNNGYGFSIAAFSKFNINKNSYIEFNICDLGSINWSNNTTKYTSIDSAYFDGISFDNNLSIIDTNYQNISTEKLKNTYIDYSNSQHFTSLPVCFNLFLKLNHSEKFTFNGTLLNKLDNNFKYQIFIGEQFNITNTLKIGINFSYGGYSKFNNGININYDTNNLSFFVNCNTINNLIFNNSLLSANIFAGLKFSI